ncbi:protein of unknown function [Rhizobium sp. RU20A]|uniref:DUF4160 domain-containing protein n=1 Tax=Rhizobium sp. RU20A TaxID=1907412 RepID=UPI000955EA4B|nr:DUF4160 domain-containing protein [Rhizobium sp. RU20A]SIR07287.1 protein of unknown function [Rhizobium sp. RU20A]
MITVLKAAGLRFVIFKDDHEPAHVHVFGDGEAKINLVGAADVTLVWARGMSRSDVRRAIQITREQRDVFRAVERFA